MKNKFLVGLTVAILGLAAGGPAFANGDGTGIVGSPHDFTDGKLIGVAGSEAWNARSEICRVCHVPHDHSKATKYYTNGLLWNHAVSAATYTMYDSTWSSSIDGAQSAQPDGTAKLCLGCHDGTVAIDTFDKYAGGTVNITTYDAGFKVPGFTDGANLDMRGTHPLSITYDAAADPGLNPTSTTMGSSGTIADVLDGGKVQCSTCHDVHNQESEPATHLLRVGQTVAAGGQASGLCLTCHAK